MSRKKLDASASYIVRELESKGRPLFEVKKIVRVKVGPPANCITPRIDAIYQVTQIPIGQDQQIHFMCNCPNSRSGRHIDDKHGAMVKDWIDRGKPKKGHYNANGEYQK